MKNRTKQESFDLVKDVQTNAAKRVMASLTRFAEDKQLVVNRAK